MKKILTAFSVIVIVLFVLSLYGWMVKHIVKGDKNFGKGVHESVNTLISFPDLFKQSVKEVQKLPETFVHTPGNFEPTNQLQKDLKALISYSNEKGSRTVDLINLKNNDILYSWEIPNPHKPHSRVIDPLLMPDKSLVYSYNGVTGLIKIDSTGKQLWKQLKIAHHHSINLDSAGNVWACTYSKENGQFIMYSGHFNIDKTTYNYIDNTISQLDAETGEILFHKSITEILRENGLEYLLVKSANSEDPYHLNDVQPALKTTAYYKEGDVFLSLRHAHTVIHYRPKTNKVIELIEGPFYSQHDVDFLSDSTIAFFNNNSHTIAQKPGNSLPVPQERVDGGQFYSNITQYDLKNKRFSTINEKAFQDNHIYSLTESNFELMEDGRMFVEEQNSGELWVIKNDTVLYKNVLNSHHDGYHHLPNWTRIIRD